MRYRFNVLFSFVLVFIIGLLGCSQSTQQDGAALAGLPDDFVVFYDQFLDDSTFQLEHIVFPLQGSPGPGRTDSTGAFIPWQKATWSIHKRISNIADYLHTFDVLSEDLIVETIEERDAPIAMQRRYARMAEGWHLIYYVDMQPQSKKQNQ